MSYSVHCRIGSSESAQTRPIQDAVVHCRIGSSENGRQIGKCADFVHCRIGSSENLAPDRLAPDRVHCRIGSSEKVQEGGTTEQVIELISNFKAATGATQTAAPGHKQAAQAAQEAISRVTAPVPASLSDIPGGRPGDVTLNDRMASMSEIEVFNAVNLGEISQAQLDAYLNRKS